MIFKADNIKLRTRVLKSFDFDNKHRINIEKILEGEYKNRYVIKSYTKTIFGYKISTLSASNIESNFDGDRIVKVEFTIYRMLHQAVLYAKHIRNEYYHIWKKTQ